MPQIIAHRGASRECLENTLSAFQRAIDLGADAVELDVHLTADHAVVVHHDPVIRGASSLPALAGRPIASLTRAEVATFRLGEGGAAATTALSQSGILVPTLADVTALIGTQAIVYCELKGAGTARPAIDVLSLGHTPCAVHAFDHRMIADAASYAPEMARGVLEVSRHVNAYTTLAAVDGRDLWQLVEFIDEPLVREVHAGGGRVIAWTANDPVVVERLAGWGVDALCSDDVPMVRRVLGR
ncbi:MAG: glycerophosphodiester phosphodiesterase [Gemmatimonadetes bacterium]|nr:glycerophosphodiester phosphodiesterase [Gemmatimonadota bacterium]